LFLSDEKNTTIGTEGYAPPEQYRGEASPAGDVYGLGATLHHLLTKQDPRLEPPFSFQERPLHAMNPNVDPQLVTIILRCVAYNAADRYQDAQSLKQDLLRLRGSQGVVIGTSTLQGIPPRPPAAVGHSPEAVAADPRTPTIANVTPIWVFKCEDEIRSK